MWFRGPSPPAEPLADFVSFALMSCLTWPSISQLLLNQYMKLHTFVTAVPARKKVARSTKYPLQGWIACTMAVKVAVTIPAVVSDFLDQARYTSAAIAGTAMYGFMFGAMQIAVERTREC